MKLFRFMSKEEFDKYVKGEKLINTKDHNRESNRKTNSKGFCYFNYAHYKPEEIFHSLTGIIGLNYICCIFETKKENVIKTWGRYSKAVDKNSIVRETFIATEYCTTEYSKETFKLIKYAIPDWFNWDSWEWREEKLQ